MIAEVEVLQFFPQAFAEFGTHLLTLPSSFKKKSLKIINEHLCAHKKVAA
jgi:hypothetical protein